ncbi:MAG: hypothetical protein U0414_33855 [Polyangiaceae bacterium]
MSTFSSSRIGAALAVATTLAICSDARADDVLKPSTKPLYFTTALGPAIGFALCDTVGHCASGTPQTAALWWNEFGYHFSGKGDGPFLAGYFHLGGNADAVRLGVGAKFGWDISVYKKAIFIQPNTSIGYGFTSPKFAADQHYAAWTLGAQIKFVLSNVGIIYAQPITFEVDGNDVGVILGWDLLFGGGVQF